MERRSFLKSFCAAAIALPFINVLFSAGCSGYANGKEITFFANTNESVLDATTRHLRGISAEYMTLDGCHYKPIIVKVDDTDGDWEYRLNDNWVSEAVNEIFLHPGEKVTWVKKG